MAVKMKFFKLKTQYAEKWHIIAGKSGGSFASSLCGYPSMRYLDRWVSVLPKGGQICKTCLLVQAHEKQQLHRV